MTGGRLAEAFAALHAETLDATVPFGAAGHAVLPAAVLARCDDHTVPLAELTVGPDRWVAVRSARPDPPEPPTPWRTGLLLLRLDASRWLLAQCLAYLSGRASGDTQLVNHQLVRADLADAAADQLIVELSTSDGLDPAGTGELHDRLVRTDRTLLRLLGAAGYLSDGPGQVALLSELLADVYGTVREDG